MALDGDEAVGQVEALEGAEGRGTEREDGRGEGVDAVSVHLEDALFVVFVDWLAWDAAAIVPIKRFKGGRLGGGEKK